MSARNQSETSCKRSPIFVIAPVQLSAPLRHWLGRKRSFLLMTTSPAFHDQVIAILPKLRVQALALTRNRTAAEDLVQDSVCNALSAQNTFVPGTNFPAWMHRILRNRFISNLRKRRDTTDIDDV